MGRSPREKFADKKSEKTTKEQVLEFVASVEKGIVWPERDVKRGKFAGQRRIINEAFDMADAYIVGKSFLIEKNKKIN